MGRRTSPFFATSIAEQSSFTQDVLTIYNWDPHIEYIGGWTAAGASVLDASGSPARVTISGGLNDTASLAVTGSRIFVFGQYTGAPGGRVQYSIDGVPSMIETSRIRSETTSDKLSLLFDSATLDDAEHEISIVCEGPGYGISYVQAYSQKHVQQHTRRGASLSSPSDSGPPTTAQIFIVIAAACGTVIFAFCIRYLYQHRSSWRRWMSTRTDKGTQAVIFDTYLEPQLQQVLTGKSVQRRPRSVSGAEIPPTTAEIDIVEENMDPPELHAPSIASVRPEPPSSPNREQAPDHDRASNHDRALATAPDQGLVFLKSDPMKIPRGVPAPRVPRRSADGGYRLAGGPPGEASADDAIWDAVGQEGTEAEAEAEARSVDTLPPGYRSPSGASRRQPSSYSYFGGQGGQGDDAATEAAGSEVDGRSLKTLPPEYQRYSQHL